MCYLERRFKGLIDSGTLPEVIDAAIVATRIFRPGDCELDASPPLAVESVRLHFRRRKPNLLKSRRKCVARGQKCGNTAEGGEKVEVLTRRRDGRELIMQHLCTTPRTRLRTTYCDKRSADRQAQQL
jgi:hypothetical protein